MVTLRIDEDLRLVLESAKRRGVDDAIAVPLVGRPVRVFSFRKLPALAVAASHGVWRQQKILPPL
jgi:hypothetical protein